VRVRAYARTRTPPAARRDDAVAQGERHGVRRRSGDPVGAAGGVTAGGTGTGSARAVGPRAKMPRESFVGREAGQA
jgi:hypothetical protein